MTFFRSATFNPPTPTHPPVTPEVTPRSMPALKDKDTTPWPVGVLVWAMIFTLPVTFFNISTINARVSSIQDYAVRSKVRIDIIDDTTQRILRILENAKIYKGPSI